LLTAGPKPKALLTAGTQPKLLTAGAQPKGLLPPGPPAINNPIPSRLARVVQAKYANSPQLGGPGATDAFVTAADALQGLNSADDIARALTLLDDQGNLIRGPFAVIEFNTPAQGLASPILRTNPGFAGKGLTAGGLPEFVVPNLPIKQLVGVTTRIVQ
jgi:hypothetical protein